MGGIRRSVRHVDHGTRPHGDEQGGLPDVEIGHRGNYGSVTARIYEQVQRVRQHDQERGEHELSEGEWKLFHF